MKQESKSAYILATEGVIGEEVAIAMENYMRSNMFRSVNGNRLRQYGGSMRLRKKRLLPVVSAQKQLEWRMDRCIKMTREMSKIAPLYRAVPAPVPPYEFGNESHESLSQESLTAMGLSLEHIQPQGTTNVTE